MQRLLISTAALSVALLAGAPAQAQTTIKITMPDSSSCVYPTGPVSSNSTAGQLQATATAAGSGAGCTPIGVGSSVSFGPASPLAPASTTLTSNAAGESATLTFQAVGATQCTGVISGAAGGTFTTASPFCTDSVGCAAQKSIGVSLPYNNDTMNAKTYDVAVTCSAGIQSAVSHATVIVNKLGGPPPGGACQKTVPSGTAGITSFVSAANLSVNYLSGGVRSVDTSSFTNVFGGTHWPGTFGMLAIASLPKDKYMSMQFTVPDGYMEGFVPTSQTPSLYGNYFISETGYSGTGSISITISTNCGDFVPAGPGSSVVPGCWQNKLIADRYLSWTKSSSCQLSSGQTYYLNVINANILNLTPTGGTATSTADAHCQGGVCTVPIQNTGSWANYSGN